MTARFSCVEDEFLQQMDRLKAAFGEERQQLQARIDVLQQEIDDINVTRDREDRCAAGCLLQRPFVASS